MIDAQLIWEWIKRNILLLILGITSLIQITPIKINPWSAFFKWIGSIIIGDTNKKIDELVVSVKKLETEVSENEKDRIRWEILDFANSCHHGREHTRDEFKHIIELNDKYKNLLQRTNDQNGVFTVEYTYIKNLYNELNLKNKFLE